MRFVRRCRSGGKNALRRGNLNTHEQNAANFPNFDFFGFFRATELVSLYGQPADMAAINAIAARHGGIPVIEDAAQSFGATFEGRRSCGLSTIGCTSFFPSKPLGCYGNGGVVHQ